MRLKLLVVVVAGVSLLVGLLGCSASTDQGRSRSSSYGSSDSAPRIGGSTGVTSIKAAAKATATEVDYYGWKAYKLTNGLVTVIAVPGIGGRVMEYRLGEYPFLWANTQELRGSAQAPADDGKPAARTWANYGGYKVWPAPQSEWGGPPDPEGSQLDSGRWTGRIVTPSGPSVSVEMTSPADAQVTGLQMVRRLSLGTGSTELAVTETYENVSKREVSWSVWGIAQVPGSVEPGEKVSSQACVYFPLNPASRHSEGFTYLVSDPAGQFKKVAGGKVLQTAYGGQVAKVGADPTDGWIAFVDEMQDLAFVQSYEVKPGGSYPDSGSTVQVYTSPATLGYMEMETLSPIRKLSPGEKFSFDTRWFSTNLGGPIVKVTDAGAIASHPVAARKDDKLIISGQLGVFAPGTLTVEVRDEKGKRLSASKPLTVTPARAVSLNVTVDMPQGAHSAMVVLTGTGGRKLGDLALVPLSASLARTAPTAGARG